MMKAAFTSAVARRSTRVLSLAAIAGAAAMLTACGAGTGTANYVMDASGKLVSASASQKNTDGTTTNASVKTASTATGTTATATTTTAPTTSTVQLPLTTVSTSAPAPVGQDATQYTLAFKDEFDSYNGAVWNDHIWYETANATKNYAVEDGKLKIWPQRDASGKFFNRTIDTDGKYTQTYGFFEIEAKLPIGKGTWPAFWLFNHIGDRRPEIDVMEAYAGGGPNSGWSDANYHPTAFASTIWIDASVLGGTKTIVTPDLSAAFHKYGLKWEPTKLTFYFDGKEVYSSAQTFKDPMYLMLDLWYGSVSGQPDSTTPTGKANSYEVNYVRAWKFK